MRTLLTGLIVFALWATLSTLWYVCTLKGLCNNSVAQKNEAVIHENKMLPDTLTHITEGQDYSVLKENMTIPQIQVIYYPSDNAKFSAKYLTDKYLDQSNTYLRQDSDAIMNITGYTDASGSEEYNKTLGFSRAQGAQQYFVRKGIPADKIKIDSKGEEQPVGDNSTEEGKAKNRRTVITIKK